jgi:predicted cupin superfamily sugar epimerase
MNAQDIIRKLSLLPHPEGGWYREVHRSGRRFPVPSFPSERTALTAIYFLLEEGDFSAFHTVRSEEAWVHLAGAPLELVVLDREGLTVNTLGGVAEGREPIWVVPPDALQAARSLGPFTLVSCFVAPGFEFEDFTMPPRGELLARHPEHADLVRRYTRAP